MIIPYLQSLTNRFVSGITTVQKDSNGHGPEFSGYGQTLIGERDDKILVSFSFSNSSEDVVETLTGTGATSNSNSMAVASSGAGIGLGQLTSKRTVNYRPAHDIHCVGAYMFPDANIDANTYQYAGLIKTEDALAVGRSGTEFGILYRSFSSDTFIAQSTWNKDKLDGTGVSGFTLDPTKLNQYRFLFGWLGISPIIVQVFGGLDIGWITVHVIDSTNSVTGLIFQNPAFPMAIEAGRTSGTGAVTVYSGSWSAGITEGKHEHAGHRVFAGDLSKAIGANTETYLATFENKTTYQGQTNTVRAEAVFLSFTTDGTKNVQFRGYTAVPQSTATSTSYQPVDVDTANSVIAIDTTSTSTEFASGKFEFPVGMAKVDQLALDVGSGHFHLELLPGERFTFTALSTGASAITLGARWEEFHS